MTASGASPRSALRLRSPRSRAARAPPAAWATAPRPAPAPVSRPRALPQRAEVQRSHRPGGGARRRRAACARTSRSSTASGNVLGVFTMSGAPARRRHHQRRGERGRRATSAGWTACPRVSSRRRSRRSPRRSPAPTSPRAATRSRRAPRARSCRSTSTPHEAQQPSGPLYGVQFSQLTCSRRDAQPDAGHGRAAALAARPLRRSRRPAALQERHAWSAASASRRTASTGSTATSSDIDATPRS